MSHDPLVHQDDIDPVKNSPSTKEREFEKSKNGPNNHPVESSPQTKSTKPFPLIFLIALGQTILMFSGVTFVLAVVQIADPYGPFVDGKLAELVEVMISVVAGLIVSTIYSIVQAVRKKNLPGHTGAYLLSMPALWLILWAVTAVVFDL